VSFSKINKINVSNKTILNKLMKTKIYFKNLFSKNVKDIEFQSEKQN